LVLPNRLILLTSPLFFFFNGIIVHAEPLIKPGDRVVFLGGTFIERMQNYGHVEAEISSRISRVTYRNLGWSGDNVWGESRAVFGTVAQGFQRLQRDMELARPSVIIVSYGANEAHDGIKGLSRFVEGYQILLDELKTHDAKIVLLTPLYYEDLGPPLPNPDTYNDKLKQYIDAIEVLAGSNNLPVVHLSKIRPSTKETEQRPRSWRVLPDHTGLTNNGVHLTAYGYQVLARLIVDGLDLPSPKVTITDSKGSNVAITNYVATPDSVKFVMTPERLLALQRVFTRQDTKDHANQLRIQFNNLRPGKYTILVDDVKVLRVSSSQLKTGALMPTSFCESAIKQLYMLTEEKNVMFFHRHRPQNETYLFLFRKHEQGNNAVEVPRFDPIIEGYEKQIRSIQNSTSYRVEIRRD